MTETTFAANTLPAFSSIRPDNIAASFQRLLDQQRKDIAALLTQPGPFTWDNLMQPLEDMSDEVGKLWSPIAHLHGVLETDALREAYNNTLPILTAFQTDISQNETLYRAILSIADSDAFKKLNPARQKIIEHEIRDFKLSGIHLPADKKKRLADLEQELSQLMTKFSENVLDASHAWTLYLTDANQLAGLPPQALQLAIDNAKQRNLEGYVLTLDYPSYSTGMKFLHDRALRKQLYEAYSTRASDQGPNAGKWDNSTVMDAILRVRTEIAHLVGFETYAHYSLATKMAKHPDDVLGFLNDLVTRSKPIAEKEYKTVAKLAKERDHLDSFELWDFGYYSEQLQAAEFHFTQEDLRPYFPINRVLTGLFTLLNKIYGITFREEKNIDTWHPDVRFFSVLDQQQQLRGGVYIDLYARAHKRDGAWMDECRIRRRLDATHVQLPVAYLTCNFMPPTGDDPALLTHDDVITLFHEFGHCLHHMLSKVDDGSVSGINGVPWDAVEFPSQFMENFCWEKELLNFIAAHYQTGAPLPDDLYAKMLAAKHFQTGLQMIRQLEFSLFDFDLHLHYDPTLQGQVQATLNAVRKKTAVSNTPPFNRFQHSFSHIFAGSYGAGYYSYKWAEVLSADAYAAFEENGILDRKTGEAFMQNILEVGGVRDPMDSFMAFRGREPRIDALLQHHGIVKT